jgi:8-oxo-dGTP pyrophosphatase MutT (NUDIX family)
MMRPTREAIRGALSRRPPNVISDEGLRRAAILIPVFDDGRSVQVVLTRRSDALPHHSGQIAFPGGTRQPGDRTLYDTALRETEEEVGIRASDVDLLGRLDDMVTMSSRFVVAPFVGFIPYPYPFRPNPAEIAELIPLPLSLLGDPSCVKEEVWDRDGAKTSVCVYTLGSLVVWGLTARILKQFLEVVASSERAFR